MNQNLIQFAIQGVVPSAVQTGLYTELCTIQLPDGVFDDRGFPSGNYVNAAGLIDIQCMVAPVSSIRISAKEQKTVEEITASSLFHVLLAGYYPSIDMLWRSGAKVVLNDLNSWDIIGVESDSQSQMTRLQVGVATV